MLRFGARATRAGARRYGCFEDHQNPGAVVRRAKAAGLNSQEAAEVLGFENFAEVLAEHCCNPDFEPGEPD